MGNEIAVRLPVTPTFRPSSSIDVPSTSNAPARPPAHPSTCDNEAAITFTRVLRTEFALVSILSLSYLVSTPSIYVKLMFPRFHDELRCKKPRRCTSIAKVLGKPIIFWPLAQQIRCSSCSYSYLNSSYRLLKRDKQKQIDLPFLSLLLLS